MNPVVWLRIAAILTLIHAIMHTIGGVLSKPLPGTASMVAATMRDNTFSIFGETRSYADFNLGLGLAVTIFLAAGAVIFWQLGAVAQANPFLVRPILITLAAGYLAFAAVSYRYFFWGPVVAEVLIALCLVVALVGTRSAIPR